MLFFSNSGPEIASVYLAGTLGWFAYNPSIFHCTVSRIELQIPNFLKTLQILEVRKVSVTTVPWVFVNFGLLCGFFWTQLVS